MGRQARIRKEKMPDLPPAELSGTPEELVKKVVGDLIETADKQAASSTKPGVGVTIDAGIIDALVSIAFRSEQGGLLWHGWCLGRGLPVDRIYSLKMAAGEIIDSTPKPPPQPAPSR